MKKGNSTIKVNPFDQFKKRDLKLSQGYNKFIEYIEELRRNVYFIKDFEKFYKFINKNKDKKKREKRMLNFCKKYNIPIGTLEGLGYIKDGERFDWGWAGGFTFNYDMGELLDLNPKLTLSNDILTKNKNIILEALTNCYPIAIAIHKFSTKRDLLDYIKKNWHSIESILINRRKEEYTKKLEKYIDIKRFKKLDWEVRKNFIKKLFTKPYIGRLKKINWELTDFIWENRNFKSKEIKKKLDNKFPNNELIYNDILKIISLEKKRRHYKDIILRDIPEKINVYLKNEK